MEQPFSRQEQRLAIAGRHHVDQQGLAGQTGVGLGKEIALAGLPQQCLAAPHVQMFNVYPAPEYQAQVSDAVPGLQQQFLLVKGLAAGIQRRQRPLHLPVGQTAEQWSVGQILNFHGFPPAVL